MLPIVTHVYSTMYHTPTLSVRFRYVDVVFDLRQREHPKAARLMVTYGRQVTALLVHGVTRPKQPLKGKRQLLLTAGS